MVAVDVSKRNLPLALAALAFHPLMLLELKSVRVPYCHNCRASLWTLRVISAFLCIVLLSALVYIVSGVNAKLKDSDAGLYLVVICFFCIILIPFIYTALKEYFLGVNVFFQKGVFYYRFGTPRVPQFLELQGLCEQLRDNDRVWLATEMANDQNRVITATGVSRRH
jgi:hypothetical protein